MFCPLFVMERGRAPNCIYSQTTFGTAANVSSCVVSRQQNENKGPFLTYVRTLKYVPILNLSTHPHNKKYFVRIPSTH